MRQQGRMQRPTSDFDEPAFGKLSTSSVYCLLSRPRNCVVFRCHLSSSLTRGVVVSVTTAKMNDQQQPTNQPDRQVAFGVRRLLLLLLSICV